MTKANFVVELARLPGWTAGRGNLDFADRGSRSLRRTVDRGPRFLSGPRTAQICCALTADRASCSEPGWLWLAVAAGRWLLVAADCWLLAAGCWLLAARLAGCLAGWPAGCLAGWLAGCLVGRLVVWLARSLAGSMGGWLAGWPWLTRLRPRTAQVWIV